MRTPVISALAAAMTMAAALTLNAQTPAQTRPQTQPQTDRQRPTTDTQARTNTGSMQSVTVQGCLRDEKDVPGRSPNVAERAGIGEDYILMNVKMSQGSTTSGLGLATMYQIKGVSDTELKKHVGHQVEVVGTLQGDAHAGMSGTSAGTTGAGTTGAGTTGAGTTGTTGAGTSGTTGSAGTTGQRGSGGTMAQSGNRSNDDLQELHATSVKMISQTCTAQ